MKNPNGPSIEDIDDWNDAKRDAERPNLPPVTWFTCGPGCKNNGEHKWDGPVVRLENGGSSSCSICGKLALEVSMWQ